MVTTAVVLMLVICTVFTALLARMACQAVYFRSYFETKQRLQGKDPDAVLKDNFPRWLYYLIFWGKETKEVDEKW